MKNKIKKLCGYAFYIMLSNTVYGILLYSLVMWLLQYSKFYAYLGNLTFILLGILFDAFLLHKLYQPKKLANEVAKAEKIESKILTDRMIRWQLKYFISFKTSLFFFYIFILLFSQILKFNPGLVSPELGAFITSIDYSVIILLAFKDFGEEFSKDRNRMDKKLTEYDDLVDFDQK